MKLLKQDSEFHTRGVQGQHAYQVASNAKMMKLLSDNLYSDKVKAPIRELSTNALDGHVKAGTQDKPFRVHLPTRADCRYAIRDFGSGMPPEQLETMYRTYGASDKMDSNDFQGCMGLGSKSPFAYTNSFTTTSYYNGKKYVYINAKDDAGIPTLNRMLVEDTDEPNGIEVSFAVRPHDITEFAEKAGQVYRDFPVTPIIEGNKAAFNMPTNKYVYESKNGWRVIKNDRWGQKQSYAIMGYVRYPITADAMKEDADRPTANNETTVDWYQHGSGASGRRRDDKKDQNYYIALLNMGLEIDFGIGEIEMDISRESLQYNKATIEAIKAKLDEVMEELKKWIESRFKNCDHLWEARCLYHDLMSGEFSSIEDLAKMVKTEWKGVDLRKQINLKDFKNKMHVYKTCNGQLKRSTYINQIPIERDLKIYVNDMKTGAYAGCNREIANGVRNEIYLFTFEDDAEKQKFFDETGLNESYIKYCSDIPKAARIKRGPQAKVFKFSKDDVVNYDNKAAWKDDQVDMDNGGYYVTIANWKIDDDEVGTPVGLKNLIEVLTDVGIKIPEIHGIKRAATTKFENHKDWQEFTKWAKAKFNTYLQTGNLEQLAKDVHAYNKLSSVAYWFADSMEPHLNSLDKTSTLRVWVEKVLKYRAIYKLHSKKIEKVLQIARTLGHEISTKSNSLDQGYEAVLDHYPMMKHIDMYTFRYEKKLTNTVLDYCKLVDSK